MDETKLIQNCQKGEKQAFNELIKFYYPYLSKFLLKLTSDQVLSEDLLQETFMKVIRNIEKFDIYGKATFSTYILTIARNCYIDYLRKNINMNLDIYELDVDDGINLENTVLNHIEVSEILKEMDKLPYEQAEAIKMKYLEQLTLKEIAVKFKTEPKTIKSRIHSGITKLNKILHTGGKKYG